MICLLRVGFDDEEELDDAVIAPVTERLGNYRIEHRDDGALWELGRGAMGVTYRAVDTSLQRPVALKLIDSEWVKQGAEPRERFMREARVAAALRHPNVAAVYHFGIREENGQCFCAMELIEGETLEMRVRRTGPIDALTTVEIGLQVSSALAAAEKQGLVHRDLKPANLMLVGAASDANGSNPGAAEEVVVKVIDFGVAKALVEKPDAMGLTHGGFVGTPAFASPEQFTNSPVDVRSDIYSLGATLWYLLTGQMPFAGGSVEEIRARHSLHALPVEQLKAADVPKRLASLVIAMLAREPAARPGIRALTGALRQCQAGILDRWKPARQVAVAAGLAGVATLVFTLFPGGHDRVPSSASPPGDSPEKSVAVLPFDNLGNDHASASVAATVQEEILNGLAKVADLKVIGRTSVMHYENARRNLADVARTLNVAHVVEGRVQRTGDRVLVSSKLINTRTYAQLWSQTYERELKYLPALNSEIARTIAEKLNAQLSPDEKAAIEKPATTDLEAYDLYLRASTLLTNTTWHERREDRFKEAIGLLEQAVARDPSFLLAYCKLAGAHDALYAYGIDHTAARLASAEAAIENALRLAPKSGEAHLALAGHLRRAPSEYKRAGEELAIARQQLPNDPAVFTLAGDLDEREGRHEEAVPNFERAVELDPRNIDLLQRLAIAYEHRSRFADMAATLDRALLVAPGDALTRVSRGMVDLFWRADTRRLHATIESIALEDPEGVKGLGFNWSILALCERDPAAIERLHKTIRDDNLDNGLVAWMTGDHEKARIAFTLERDALAKLVEAQGGDALWISLLGVLEATLGRKEEALGAGRRAVELRPRQGEIVANLAIAAAWVGEKDLAIEQLKSAVRLSNSFAVHYGYLKLHPFWDPLRGDPRFEAIVSSLAPKDAGVPEKSIAVLPFENLSDDKSNAYFASGVQDEILTHLAKIADLKVISRTSVMQYTTGAQRNLREIGKQLGVAHLLEGSVQRTANRVRVNAQLIDARTDAHLWAQTYDRELADVFAIQSEIAKTIADQLQARLSFTEKAAIEQRPTADLAAFDLYTRAKTLRETNSRAYSKNNRLQAVDLLNQAVTRDPAFLLAWCELAITHDMLYLADLDHTPARLALANAAVQTALRLRPDAGEAHLALAHHLYQGYLDYDRARAELAIAQRTLPNDPSIFTLAGNMDRRQGRWAESTRNLERAIELDPRNFPSLQNLSSNYEALRRYAEMLAVLDRALAIAPKDVDTRIARASIDLDWRADPRPLHTTIEAILAEDPAAAPALADSWLFLALFERDPVAVGRALAALGGSGVQIDAAQLSQAFCEGLVARVRGDGAAARAAFTIARVQQEEVTRAQPDYAPALSVLGLIDAGLGRKEQALREGRRAVELLPVARNSFEGALGIQFFAIICAWTGEKDLALQQLEISTQIPAPFLSTYGKLRLHPFWDPLRGDPRFEKIVASLAPK